MKAVVHCLGRPVITVELGYELAEGLTKSDVVLQTTNNPILVELSGGDVSRLREAGRFISLVLSQIEKDPKCVSRDISATQG